MVLMEITCVFYDLFCGPSPTGPQTYCTLFFGGMAKKGSIDSPLDGLQPPTTPGTHITTISYMSTCVICVCILVHTYTPTLKKYVSTKGEAKGRLGGTPLIVPHPDYLTLQIPRYLGTFQLLWFPVFLVRSHQTKSINYSARQSVCIILGHLEPLLRLNNVFGRTLGQ